MPLPAKIVSLFRSFFYKAHLDSELDAELRSYLDMLTEEKIKAGLPPDQARRQARIELGGMEQVKMKVREVRLGTTLETVWQDIRYGVRFWMRNPGTAAVAALVMALGIGLMSVQFSLMNGVLLRGLPFEDSARIYYIERLDRQTQLSLPLPLDDFLAFRARQESFEELGAFATEHKTFSGGEGLPVRYRAADVSVNLLALLRVQPMLGRGFRPEEARMGAPWVILLSEAIWRRDFSSSPDVLGQSVHLDGHPATVIGVLPPGFHFPEDQDLWVNLKKEEGGAGPSVEIFGRLKETHNAAQAQAEFDVLAEQLQLSSLARDRMRYATRVVPFVRHYTGDMAELIFFTMLMMGAGVLLIACGNVMNLGMAMACRRERELSIRVALGASRSRVVRQMLVESTVLAALGGAGGVLLTLWGTRLINVSMAGAETPFWYHAEFDWRVLVFMAVLTLGAGAVSGLLPALRASRLNPQRVLQEHGPGGSTLRAGKLSRLLVGAQVAVACGLLGVTGMLVKSVVRAQAVNLPYDPAQYVTAQIQLPGRTFASAEDRLRFFTGLRQEISTLPGLQGATLTSRHPVSRGMAVRFELQGRPVPDERELPFVRLEITDENYFTLMNVPVLEGRGFAATDRIGSELVAVVTKGFARAAWPDQSPLGKHLRRFGRNEGWATVIGVVPDILRAGTVHPNHFPGVYLPQSQQAWPNMILLAKTQTDPAGYELALKQAVYRLAPDLAAEQVRPLSAAMDELLAIPRLVSRIFESAGLAAMLLAAFGIFGVVSAFVGQRTREFAIRSALGAQRHQIVGQVLRHTALHVSSGLVVGNLLAFALGKPIASELLGVSAFDWTVSLVVALSLTAAALLASALPAYRATRIDPMVALRYE